jgi:hypothetical protein
MNNRNSGIALIVFTILLVCTMVLHPSGGSIEHLMEISNLIIITHSIAILSLPIGWLGFYGLTRKLGTDHFGSMLGLVIISFALIAVLLAAATNGLVLPIFLQHYTGSISAAIIQYSFSVNHAFDYIYTGAFCLAILSWSVSIVHTRKLAVWIGWMGIALFCIIAAIFISGVAVNNVHGLRIFTTGIVSWILLVGGALYKTQTK